MIKKKRFQDLTFKDNFMFSAVMLDPENCRLVLERILGISISKVVVSKEKSIIYHPEYKGIRLDVYAADENNTHYDIEMQVVPDDVIKRARFYHSQMDMELLSAGESYHHLKNAYVIFICDFDPFKLSKYKYTIKSCFKEDVCYNYDDGQHTIFLNTKGTNDSEESEELINFLKFIGSASESDLKDFDDPLISRIKQSVESIKYSKELGERYMLFEELLAKEYQDGLTDGKLANLKDNILSVLSVRSITLTETEQAILLKTDNLDILETLLQLSVTCTKEEFINELNSN